MVKLSGMMRYVISEASHDFVPLEKEISYISDYIDLQKIRFGDTVKIDYKHCEPDSGKSIAPLILIPFIENAFKFGVNPEENSFISVILELSGSELHLGVFNHKIVEKFCTKVDFIDLVKTFTKPEEAMKYIAKFPVDLIFLDIRMPSMTGVQFRKQLSQEIMVIFTTAYSEYAVEGFNLNAVDYLLKPFTFDRFQQAVNKAHDYYEFLHHHELAVQQYLFVRADYSLVKVMHQDIFFIEGLDDYLKIYTSAKKPVIAKIEKVRNKTIYIGDKTIPIGASYEKEFLEIYGK